MEIDLIHEYNNLYEENKALRKQNTKYIDDLSELEDKVNNLKSQVDDTPEIELSDLALKVNGDPISINSTNARAKIDGKEYFSREITEKLLSENQSIKVKDNTLYIGKVIAEQASLFSQWIMEGSSNEQLESLTDSYGNTYPSAIQFSTYGKLIYNLDNKYKYLKFTLAAHENMGENEYGVIKIKSDNNEILYTSPQIDLYTKPMKIDIPINNCSILKIYSNGTIPRYFIISDAILYN